MLKVIAATVPTVLSVIALIVSGLSWRATHRQAVEARRSRELLEEQHHQQSKPDKRLTIGAPPEQGWIPVELWCPVGFDSATLTLPREYMNELFAGFGPGPDEPHRLEYSQTFEFPATAAGTTVRCGLWVYQVGEIAGRQIRLLCEIRSNGRPWNYTVEHTFPNPAADIARLMVGRPGR